MARQDANQAFAATSFLYGANAPYIEQLQARYAADPNSVDGEWRSFFEGLKDAPDAVKAGAEGPPWRRADWPPVMNGELVSALDGNWPALEAALGQQDQGRRQPAAAPRSATAPSPRRRAIRCAP